MWVAQSERRVAWVGTPIDAPNYHFKWRMCMTRVLYRLSHGFGSRFDLLLNEQVPPNNTYSTSLSLLNLPGVVSVWHSTHMGRFVAFVKIVALSSWCGCVAGALQLTSPSSIQISTTEMRDWRVFLHCGQAEKNEFYRWIDVMCAQPSAASAWRKYTMISTVDSYAIWRVHQAKLSDMPCKQHTSGKNTRVVVTQAEVI